MEKQPTSPLSGKTRRNAGQRTSSHAYAAGGLDPGAIPGKPSREEIHRCIEIWARFYRVGDALSREAHLVLPHGPKQTYR